MDKKISGLSILGCILICFSVVLLHSCIKSSTGGIASHTYIYKNESTHHIKIEKYFEDGTLRGAHEIPQSESIHFNPMIQGETLIYSYASIRVIFDASKELWFREINREEPGNIYNEDNYENIGDGELEQSHTYTFTDEHYNMATPIQ